MAGAGAGRSAGGPGPAGGRPVSPGLLSGAAGGEKAIKALLAADDRDLRSHSLTALLRELGAEPAERWQRQARVLDKLYAPTRYPDALGDELPAAVFGPEDAAAALEAAITLLTWAGEALEASDGV